jgi:hypothetical protein
VKAGDAVANDRAAGFLSSRAEVHDFGGLNATIVLRGTVYSPEARSGVPKAASPPSPKLKRLVWTANHFGLCPTGSQPARAVGCSVPVEGGCTEAGGSPHATLDRCGGLSRLTPELPFPASGSWGASPLSPRPMAFVVRPPQLVQAQESVPGAHSLKSADPSDRLL